MAGREPTGADAEQGIAAAYPRQNDRRVVGGEGKVGIVLQIVAHKVGEITGQQGFRAGDGEGALIRQILAIGQHPLHFGQTRGHSLQQLLRLRGEADLAPLRLDQLLAKAQLQLGNPLAYRRLADIEATGHLGHGSFARQQAQRLQPFQ